MQKNLLKLTEQLIRFRSTASRPEELLKCFDFVEKYLLEAGIKSKRIVFNNKHSLYVGRVTKPPVLLCGHLDVVDGENGQFTPRLEGDKLLGRGSLDMKSGDAVLIEYTKNNFKTNENFGLLLTGDEEIGGMNGVGNMVDLGYGATEAVVVPDGGQSELNLVVKEKGVLQLAVIAEGKAAHGSRPWSGISAISILNKFLSKFETLFTPHHEHPEDHWITTCNIGTIEGGVAVNQVPDLATAHCDVRYTEKDQPDNIIERAKKLCPPEIQIEVMFNEPMVLADPDCAALKHYRAAIKSITGKTAKIIFEHGSSDARFFTINNVPVIISQPTGEGMHGPDEWVRVESIDEYYKILEDFMKRVSV